MDEAPNLCVAVPAPNRGAVSKNAEICKIILPPDWVKHCVHLMKTCRSQYREHQNADLRDEKILLKFQLGHSNIYTKVTGTYIYTMGAWYGTRSAFRMIEEFIEWIKEIDVEADQLGSLFGEGTLIDTGDVCSCLANLNIRDDEEKALLGLIHDEAGDVAMAAAISVMCEDANSRQPEQNSVTFTTQLMAMGTDTEKIEWLKQNIIVETTDDKIVGALWVNTNHWCGIGINLKKYVYSVMDPRNDKDTIELVDGVFKHVFLPILPKEKRWRRDVSRFYQQVDGNSCGVFVLAFIESYLFGSLDIPADTKLLRFRYLLKVLLG